MIASCQNACYNIRKENIIDLIKYIYSALVYAATEQLVKIMKILVLSDSHSSLRFMRSCMEKVRPDVMIHLGDYYDDGKTIADEFPAVTVYQVPGNCDQYRCPVRCQEVFLQTIGSVKFYLTHGHRHRVKSGLWSLLRDAREGGVDVVLYGHTHAADCHREEDGLWVLNPGSCGYYGGKAGIIEIKNGSIEDMYVIDHTDLEEML